MPLAFAVASGMTDDDIVYICLPLYHSVGGVIAMGQMAATGKTVVLARKFSARQFWKDCIKHKCTVSLKFYQNNIILFINDILLLQKLNLVSFIIGSYLYWGTFSLFNCYSS